MEIWTFDFKARRHRADNTYPFFRAYDRLLHEQAQLGNIIFIILLYNYSNIIIEGII